MTNTERLARVILKTAAMIVRRGWTQKTMACDEHGVDVWHDDPKATCFCTFGAVSRAGDAFGAPVATCEAKYLLALHLDRQRAGGEELCEWFVDTSVIIEEVNDGEGMTKTRMANLIDRAAERT